MKQLNGIPIAFPYKHYAQPRRGLFMVYCPSNEYCLKTGLKKIEQVITIIGETDTQYIDQLKFTSSGLNGKGRKYVLPLGTHKTRLVQWLDAPEILF